MSAASRSADSVSVIIPTYNRADLLPRAIASALGQTHPPAEVIVVDDGSTDDTATRCREWGDRIRYMRIPNGGVAAARNAGIAAARGDWVALLDSDDTWESMKLEVQLAAHNVLPDAAWSITGCTVVDDADQPRSGAHSFASAFPVFREAGRDPDALFAQHLRRVVVSAAGVDHVCFHGDLFGLLFLGNVALPSSALVRRSFLATAGGFDASLRLAEETEYFHRAAAHSSVIVVMSSLVRYRAANSDSLTAATNAAALTEAALRSLESASSRRVMHAGYRQAQAAGRRNLLLRLAYAQLSVRDGAAARQTLRRLDRYGVSMGRRGAAIWAASLLPPSALETLHTGKRWLRSVTRR